MMSDQKVLLTQDQIDRWREQKADYEKVIAEAQRGLAEVNRKLNAANILLGPDLAVPGQEKASESQVSEEHLGPMTDAVIRVVRELGGAARRREVKDALRKAGYPDSRLGNYFYTVMARHVAKGNLTKDGNRYSLPPGGEPDPEDQEAPSASPSQVPLGASIETGLAIQ